MLWTRKKSSLNPPTREVAPMDAKHGEKRVTKKWSYEKAAYVYSVEVYTEIWSLSSRGCSMNGLDHHWSTGATGDEAWAERNAEHLGVEIVEIEA